MFNQAEIRVWSYVKFDHTFWSLYTSLHHLFYVRTHHSALSNTQYEQNMPHKWFYNTSLYSQLPSQLAGRAVSHSVMFLVSHGIGENVFKRKNKPNEWANEHSIKMNILVNLDLKEKKKKNMYLICMGLNVKHTLEKIIRSISLSLKINSIHYWFFFYLFWYIKRSTLIIEFRDNDRLKHH